MLKVNPKRFGTTVVLCLQGRVVIGEIAALRRAIESLTNISVVVLDLASVSLIDAAGLGALLELRKQANDKGIQLKLMNASERVTRILEMTRLNTVFETTSLAFFPQTPLKGGSAQGFSRLRLCS
jgi:anti-sigma B factor antagonist